MSDEPINPPPHLIAALTLLGLLLEWVVLACAFHFQTYSNHEQMMAVMFGLGPAIALITSITAYNLSHQADRTFWIAVIVVAIVPVAFLFLLLLLWGMTPRH